MIRVPVWLDRGGSSGNSGRCEAIAIGVQLYATKERR